MSMMFTPIIQVIILFRSICYGSLDYPKQASTNGRKINNLRFADDTIPMAESKEELKSLLMRVKEEK